MIFDCDGTLIDSQNAIVEAINDVFSEAEFPAPTRNDVMGIIGLSLPEAFAVLAPDATATERHNFADQYKAAFTVRRAHQAHEEPLYPGISSVIAQLAGQSDVALAIATGKSRRGVDRLLAREGWTEAFDSIQTADQHPSKPHPSMIMSALQETGGGTDEAVMIGDTTFDMEMARSAGVAALGVGWGYHSVPTLQRAGAEHITLNVETLLTDIERLCAQRSPVLG